MLTMDYSHYDPNDILATAYCMESSHLQPDMGFIDPRLENSSASHIELWSQPEQIQRYLTEQSKTHFTVPGTSHPDTMLAGNYSRQLDVVHALPTASNAFRHGSPYSNQPSDTTCTSAVSPRGDSEIFYEHSPPTPPDMTTLLPYQGNIHFGMEGSLGQEQQLAGLASLPRRSYVNMGEVNPSQGTQLSFDETAKPQFEPLYRGFSMSSEEGHYETPQGIKYEQIRISRQMSPDDFDVPKDEIRIPDPHSPKNSGVYPSFDSEDETQSEQDLEVAAQAQDHDDRDYHPSSSKRQKRNAPTTGRASRARKRANNASTSSAKKPRVSNTFPSVIPTAISSGRGSLRCSECHKTFYDGGSLDKHIKSSHTRSFVCVFNFAGCTSTFASKNEWKRHATTQHLLLNYWICGQDACAKVTNGSRNTTISAKTNGPAPSRNVKSKNHAHTSAESFQGPSPLPNGAIFNRKDLFTQHVRRMHIPPQIKKQVKQKKTVPEWEVHTKRLQEDCHRERCKLPDHMLCPGNGGRCGASFHGKNAWDERMEHVAKHLEKAAVGEEPTVVFGGDEDPTLTMWASRPDVAVIRRDERGCWVENNPMKSTGGPQKGGKDNKPKHVLLPQRRLAGSEGVEKEIVVVETSEEDAEGEEVDE